MNKRMHRLLASLFVVALHCGCDATDQPSLPDEPTAKADLFEGDDAPPFAFGIYQSYEYEWEDDAPLMVAFHPFVGEALRGYSGYFDLNYFVYYEEHTHYYKGLFKASHDADQGGWLIELRAEEPAGFVDEAGKYAAWTPVPAEDLPGGGSAWTKALSWNPEGQHCPTLAAGDEWSVDFCRLNQLELKPGERQCHATQVLDYVFEEGFTEWEYPDIDVSLDEDGRWEVWLGAALLDSDEAQIDVSIDDATGDYRASVTDADDTLLVKIPHGFPSRGEVWIHDNDAQGDEGEGKLIARFVCYPNDRDSAPSSTRVGH